MPTEVRVPALPESVADATVLTWHFKPGDWVRKDDNLVDLETDKVVLEVPAPAEGVLAEIKVAEGELVTADSVLGQIDAQQEASREDAPQQEATQDQEEAPPKKGSPKQPAEQQSGQAPTREPAMAADARSAPAAGTAVTSAEPQADSSDSKPADEPALAPAARRLVKGMGLDPKRIPGTGKGGRITKADVIAWLDEQEATEPAVDPDAAAAARAQPEEEPPQEGVVQPPGLTGEAGRPEQRVPMTRLRARIAERLVEAQQTTAMLTTFNEVDMAAVLALRRQYRDQFETTHGVRLGLMSFFVKAAVEALQRFPVINASVDGEDIIYHGYYDIGIAVSSERGLVVPILRNCDQLSMADVERGIVDFADKAKDGSLSFEELTGGTFSITNGGVFGSLLSTPILNLPQSAILGMHSIQDRPIAVDGEVVIRPMMYLALSYDHRIVDGREAVQFLRTIKETLEDPARLLLRV
ncbi:2-oxoglutarate dehydrogenase complex dihydrolipoyllysine-residue succinyltransferase [Halochromatium glycolicum]|uniref:Dihydrolipoyllysine-residue succinyltransferase component of 2-oxoglutarate dehydrogenase complex n=1 Tax=Halochromatium glycolicum TaxID=85075 RepID=A0AAJ0X8Z4_9GAMM|nr:2-oxoglutarate dehydrogenase complex dihydrolipoyllysine-residue succinyltransferase [Halochromatium glycolicum]MBK1703147.1 dihydrolipoyllysine-residue succinyltransferase [Halochromatium glycolicum]